MGVLTPPRGIAIPDDLRELSPAHPEPDTGGPPLVPSTRSTPPGSPSHVRTAGVMPERSMRRPDTTLPDVELVELARDGDQRAFGDLVQRHDERMRGLAYRVLGDRHLMDDALQDAYVKAFRALDRFESGSDFGTWLYRITYNTCIDELRKRRRVPVSRHDPVDGVSSRPGPERIVSAADVVDHALAALPPDQRLTVVLVDGEGFDHRQAAKILGVSPGTIGSRLHRARAALRHVIGEGSR